MTTRSACLWLPALLLLFSDPAAACSSFATYSGEPLYGMNFDYSASVKLRFVIETHGDQKVFHLTFSRGARFVTTVGMNSAGLFIADQIQYGEKVWASGPYRKTTYPGQLYRWALNNCENSGEVRSYLETRRMLSDPNLGLHLLIADSSGDAFVAEVGKNENALFDIEDDFIVMTNFCHEANRDRGYDDMSGVGAERYRVIYEGLAGSEGRCDVDRAFDLLSSAKNRSSGYPTRCSMVFDPVRGEIYFALETDYTRIWKVSLAEQTIETHQGFEEHQQWALDAKGVLAVDLK